MSSVSIQSVSRTFEGRKGQRTQALLPVDFEVRDNDFVTILGPSGCGKSTLLRIVAGLDHATSGRVLLDGVPVEGPGADRGMVFQSYTLFPWLTIEQNIRFGLRERGMPEALQKERAARSRTTSWATDTPSPHLRMRPGVSARAVRSNRS